MFHIFTAAINGPFSQISFFFHLHCNTVEGGLYLLEAILGNFAVSVQTCPTSTLKYIRKVISERATVKNYGSNNCYVLTISALTAMKMKFLFTLAILVQTFK